MLSELVLETIMCLEQVINESVPEVVVFGEGKRFDLGAWKLFKNYRYMVLLLGEYSYLLVAILKVVFLLLHRMVI